MKAVFQLDFYKVQPGRWISHLLDTVGLLWVAAVILWALDIYAVKYFLLPGRTSPELSLYVIQPLLWLSLALLAFLGWQFGLKKRPRFNKALVVVALLVAVLQITVLILAGLVFGFGRSPYGHRPWVLLGNLVYVGSALIGMEFSRAYLVAALGQRTPLLAWIGLSLFFSFLVIPPGALGGFGNPMNMIQIIGATYLPTFSQNLLVTLLAAIGGPIPALVYLGILKAFEWIPPILPDLQWIIVAFLGTILPVLGVVLIQRLFLSESGVAKSNRSLIREPSNLWVLLGFIAVSLIWLNTGIFGVRPAVIVSGSMHPVLRVGDVVISREVPPEQLKPGDVIQFSQAGATIIHRVVEIHRDGNGITFITRGDRNKAYDPPVAEREVWGKIILVIPRIGWISIGLRQGIGWIL